eukprot:4141626-Pleurochrysis_carterae.AAC.1
MRFLCHASMRAACNPIFLWDVQPNTQPRVLASVRLPGGGGEKQKESTGMTFAPSYIAFKSSAFCVCPSLFACGLRMRATSAPCLLAFVQLVNVGMYCKLVNRLKLGVPGKAFCRGSVPAAPSHPPALDQGALGCAWSIWRAAAEQARAA